MPKRTICIQNPARLHSQHNALVIESDAGSTQIPFEDIWVVIIESNQVLITSYLLAELSEYGIGAITCGKDHMPAGLHLPLEAHSRHAAIVEDQLLVSKPLAKQLWQRIVKSKILNQARCLEILEIDGSRKLRQYAHEVASGDTTGREAAAAAEYFKNYITVGTRRDGPYVAPLDYGYAILRAGIARETVAGGWLISRGFHHSSNLNAFNLVDDLLEPFRPTVDLLVERERLYESFDTQTRTHLAKIFEYRVLVNGEKYTVQSAIEEELDSLKHAIKEKDASSLLLPELIPLEISEVDRK